MRVESLAPDPPSTRDRRQLSPPLTSYLLLSTRAFIWTVGADSPAAPRGRSAARPLPEAADRLTALTRATQEAMLVETLVVVGSRQRAGRSARGVGWGTQAGTEGTATARASGSRGATWPALRAGRVHAGEADQ